jgi:hypothetical protein
MCILDGLLCLGIVYMTLTIENGGIHVAVLVITWYRVQDELRIDMLHDSFFLVSSVCLFQYTSYFWVKYRWSLVYTCFGL